LATEKPNLPSNVESKWLILISFPSNICHAISPNKFLGYKESLFKFICLFYQSRARPIDTVTSMQLAGPKHHFWGRGLSLFLGENMRDFGILWEKGSQI
jgi:hypothetical protein